MLGIVVALPGEKSTLGKTQKYTEKIEQLDGQTLLIVSGAGPRNARIAAQYLLDQGITALLSWGCAAALENALQPGALIIPKRVISTSGEQRRTDATWYTTLHKRLSPHLTVHHGAIVQSDSLVTKASEKSRLFQSENAIAVDMESFALATLAYEANIPFLAVRAIADPANMPLPQSVVQAMNAEGGIEIAVLLKRLVKSPFEVSALIKLGLHFRAAQMTLARVRKITANGFCHPITPPPFLP